MYGTKIDYFEYADKCAKKCAKELSEFANKSVKKKLGLISTYELSRDVIIPFLESPKMNYHLREDILSKGGASHNFVQILKLMMDRELNALFGNVHVRVNNELANILIYMKNEDIPIESLKILDSLPFLSFYLELPTAVQIEDNTFKRFIIQKCNAPANNTLDNMINFINITCISVDEKSWRTGKIFYNGDSDKPHSEVMEHMGFITNILMYMCSYNELTKVGNDTPIEVKSVRLDQRTKKIIPPCPHKLELGVRIGAKLRQYSIFEQCNKNTSSNDESSYKLIPHVRKAHWKKVYYGPRLDSNHNPIPTMERNFTVQLIAQQFINFDIGEELAPVVRDLE